MKRQTRMQLLVGLLALSPGAVGVFASTVEHGKVYVQQVDALNNENSVVLSGDGLTPGFNFVQGTGSGTNRGDYTMSTNLTWNQGALLTSVSQNGRDNGETGTLAGTRYVQSMVAKTGTGYFVPLHDSPTGSEYNVNFAAAYLPYTSYVAGLADNSANNGNLTTIAGTTGMTVGLTGPATVVDSTTTTGIYEVDLRSFTATSAAAPVAASSANGVLLVTGARNDDNYAASRANADGTFTVAVTDNGVDNGGNGENDGFTFGFIPLGDLNTRAVGRIRGDGGTIIGSGSFSVTKLSEGRYALTIAGVTDADGTLIVSPEWEAAPNATDDNVISYEWDTLNNRWIVETRDIVITAGATPVLESAADTDPAFSFAFFAIPEPGTVGLVVPAIVGALARRRRRA